MRYLILFLWKMNLISLWWIQDPEDKVTTRPGKDYCSGTRKEYRKFVQNGTWPDYSVEHLNRQRTNWLSKFNYTYGA